MNENFDLSLAELPRTRSRRFFLVPWPLARAAPTMLVLGTPDSALVASRTSPRCAQTPSSTPRARRPRSYARLTRVFRRDARIAPPIAALRLLPIEPCDHSSPRLVLGHATRTSLSRKPTCDGYTFAMPRPLKRRLGIPILFHCRKRGRRGVEIPQSLSKILFETTVAARIGPTARLRCTAGLWPGETRSAS